MSTSTYPSLARIGLRCGSAQRQRGLTLIEFMISITIGMIIVVALTLLIARQSATQNEFEKSSRQIENGRYAMRLLSDEVQMAGYYGEFSEIGTATPPSLDPCSTDVTVMLNLMVYPVQGYDSPDPSLFSCIPAGNHKPNTDILVLRRVETELIDIPSAAATQVYVQAGLTGSGLEFEMRLGAGSSPGSFDLYQKNRTTLASLRRYVVRIYFVSPCSVTPCGTSATDGGNPIPTLKMVELSSAGTMSSITPLVEGIENMQIEYGVDSVSSDGSPDAFVSSTAAWDNVMAVRIHLVARNNDRSPDYIDTKVYQLGGGVAYSVSSADQPYKRRVFSQLVRLVNPSGRRDK